MYPKFKPELKPKIKGLKKMEELQVETPEPIPYGVAANCNKRWPLWAWHTITVGFPPGRCCPSFLRGDFLWLKKKGSGDDRKTSSPNGAPNRGRISTRNRIRWHGDFTPHHPRPALGVVWTLTPPPRRSPPGASRSSPATHSQRTAARCRPPRGGTAGPGNSSRARGGHIVPVRFRFFCWLQK